MKLNSRYIKCLVAEVCALILTLNGLAKDLSSPSTQADEIHGIEREGMRLTAVFEKSTIVQGEPIILRVFVENTSDGERDFPIYEPAHQFVFDVRDAKGNKVPLTAYGTVEQVKFGGRIRGNVLEFLPAGKRAEFRFRLDELFDLTLSQAYAVTVKFMVANAQKTAS